MHCLAVTLVAHPGSEDALLELFTELTAASRAEPGNVMYLLHRSPSEPRRFLLYEQYRSAADLEAHRATPHYRELAAGRLPALVESRSAEVYDSL